MKREDYISWDEYFMGIAMLAARRSKDPNTQVGACIVSQDNIILSTGYNGMPKGCSDDEYPWEREGIDTKYPTWSMQSLRPFSMPMAGICMGSRLYGGAVPLNECAKAIIQSGVKEVLYLSDKYADSMATLASKRMMASARCEIYPAAAEIKGNYPGFCTGGGAKMISTRGRYALRMMLDLAQNQGDGYVALRDIAARQEISKKYLEQIIPLLNRVGLLQTTGGSRAAIG